MLNRSLVHDLRNTATDGSLNCHVARKKADNIEVASKHLAHAKASLASIQEHMRRDNSRRTYSPQERTFPDIALALKKTVQGMSTRHRKVNFRSSIKPKDKNKTILIDIANIRRLVKNLIRNSERATTRKGEITVYLIPMGDSLRLIVRDTGSGMTPQQLEQANNQERFSTKEDAGHGLGLQNVHMIVKAHKGKIRFENSRGGLRVITDIPNARPSIKTKSLGEIKRINAQ